ncbi:MAG: PC4/YdbC family ssDNA-binding protein [Syntrophomonadaceae bacterium]|nr:PC4/YdbC family ssDNA-binding protein [Syntrophomonadaceae bacterium]
MSDFKFNVIKNLGVLSEGSKGWRKEFNLVSWNGHEAKFDIRDWGPNYEKVGKGVTLNQNELKHLQEILNNLDWEKD